MADLAARTQNQLFNYVQGSEVTGQSAFDIWKGLGYEGNEEDFLEFLRTGQKGDTGLTAYEEWVLLSENAGKSYEEYLYSIKGDNGKSAYEIWLEVPGNEGKTIEDFLLYIKGEKGETGPQGEKGDQGPSGVGEPINFLKIKDSNSEDIYEVFVQDGKLIVRKYIDPSDVQALLMDFDYIITEDGKYELTAWKGTLNGEPSTIISVPDNPLIRI